MKKLTSIAILLTILIAAVITCPDRQQHHDVLKQAMDQAMTQAIKDQIGADDSLFGFGLASIGTTLASKLIANVVESTLIVNDYLVISIGQVTVGGNTKTVSIGLFGHVFPTFDNEDIKKAINDN